MIAPRALDFDILVDYIVADDHVNDTIAGETIKSPFSDITNVIEEVVPVTKVVHASAEVPQVQHIDRVVDKPVVKQQNLPSVQKAHKTVEVPQVQYIDGVVDVSVVKQRQVPSVQVVQKVVVERIDAADIMDVRTGLTGGAAIITATDAGGVSTGEVGSASNVDVGTAPLNAPGYAPTDGISTVTIGEAGKAPIGKPGCAFVIDAGTTPPDDASSAPIDIVDTVPTDVLQVATSTTSGTVLTHDADRAHSATHEETMSQPLYEPSVGGAAPDEDFTVFGHAQVDYRSRAPAKVHKTVEVPQVLYIDRVVDVLVVKQRQVPSVQVVLKLADVRTGLTGGAAIIATDDAGGVSTGEVGRALQVVVGTAPLYASDYAPADGISTVTIGEADKAPIGKPGLASVVDAGATLPDDASNAPIDIVDTVPTDVSQVAAPAMCAIVLNVALPTLPLRSFFDGINSHSLEAILHANFVLVFFFP